MEVALLGGLSDEDRRRVVAATHRRRFARQEVLFHEGDPGDTLHLIVKGRLAVRATTPLGDAATLNVLGPGDVVGELALLSPGARRSATVVALEPSETMSLHRDEFEVLRQSHPSVDRFLIDALARTVGRLSGHLLEALYVPVDKRVLRRLLSLADLYGNGAGPVRVPLTQDDLAGLAGASRPTVNRVLRASEQAGHVALHRGAVEVIDRAALASRAR